MSAKAVPPKSQKFPLASVQPTAPSVLGGDCSPPRRRACRNFPQPCSLRRWCRHPSTSTGWWRGYNAKDHSPCRRCRRSQIACHRTAINCHWNRSTWLPRTESRGSWRTTARPVSRSSAAWPLRPGCRRSKSKLARWGWPCRRLLEGALSGNKRARKATLTNRDTRRVNAARGI